MHVDFVFLADAATVRPDGRIDATAIGTFTEEAETFPTKLLRFAVVTRIEFDKDDHDPGTLHVVVVSPDGAILTEQTSMIEVPPVVIPPPKVTRTRTRVLNFFHVPLPSPGYYECRVSLNDARYEESPHFEVKRSHVLAVE